MVNKNYKRGRQTEYKAIECFASVGVEADRTAGSHGVFDVIARTPVGVRFIQVKRVKHGNNWKSEYEIETEKIRQIPKTPGASYEYWIWEDGPISDKGNPTAGQWIKQEVVK